MPLGCVVEVKGKLVVVLEELYTLCPPADLFGKFQRVLLDNARGLKTGCAFRQFRDGIGAPLGCKAKLAVAVVAPEPIDRVQV
jgi:hypothetical protein